MSCVGLNEKAIGGVYAPVLRYAEEGKDRHDCRQRVSTGESASRAWAFRKEVSVTGKRLFGGKTSRNGYYGVRTTTA